jgi:hypothetical protein
MEKRKEQSSAKRRQPNEGEGNKTAAARYNREASRSAGSRENANAAREAARSIGTREEEELREAEKAGRAPARDVEEV